MLGYYLRGIFGKIDNEDGQGMVEYALLVGLIAVVVIAALLILGPLIAAKFGEISAELAPVTP